MKSPRVISDPEILGGTPVFIGPRPPCGRDGWLRRGAGEAGRCAGDLPPELEQELDESLAQSIRGETIPVAEVLNELRVY